MTTDALLQTVINYPFRPDMYAFNNLLEGYETVKRRFNGLQKLENRKDALDVLSRYCRAISTLDVAQQTRKDDMVKDLYLLLLGDYEDSYS